MCRSPPAPILDRTREREPLMEITGARGSNKIEADAPPGRINCRAELERPLIPRDLPPPGLPAQLCPAGLPSYLFIYSISFNRSSISVTGAWQEKSRQT